MLCSTHSHGQLFMDRVKEMFNKPLTNELEYLGNSFTDLRHNNFLSLVFLLISQEVNIFEVVNDSANY